MMGFLKLAIRQHKATYSLIAFVLLAGLVSRNLMTIESFPPVTVPIVFATVVHPGISPEDGSRLLLKPMEQELKSLDGIVEITGTARENVAYIVAEFDSAMDIDVALTNMREAIDRAKAEFPDNTDEPMVEEVMAEGGLVVVVSFSSDVASERELFQIAKSFQQDFEGMNDVLEATLKGAREEVTEIMFDPAKLEYFSIAPSEVINVIQQNNILIAAGDLDSGRGNFGVKVPGLIETVDDIRSLPIRSSVEGVITLDQVAQVRRTFKDASDFGRVNSRPALTLEIVKRLEANTIDTVVGVREHVIANQDRIPGNINVEFVYDNSSFTESTVNELTGNIISAMALVMVLVVASLGLRSGLLVGFGIPFSLLGAGIVVYLLGFSFNFMVIFGLILALGMLIDGALVVVEYAQSNIQKGMTPQDAYLNSVGRMAVPIIASTLTTLAAFLPLLFWPGVVGEFMGYLPKTVFAVLGWSLVFSLIVVPVLGARLIPVRKAKETHANENADETDEEAVEFSGARELYLSALKPCLANPIISASAMILILVGIFFLFGRIGPGVEFFAESEDVFATASIRAQGNLTIDEEIELVQLVEEELAKVPELKSYYISTNGIQTNTVAARDQIASILLELVHPTLRDISSGESLDKIRALTDQIPGIIVQVNKIEGGPPVGKDIQIEMSSPVANREQLHETAKQIRQFFNTVEGLRDVEDTLSLPGIEWQFNVDKASAAMLGLSVGEIGQMIQLMTDGLYLGEYRPDDADDEVEIRLRYPDQVRTLDGLRHLRIMTSQGPVPISSFVTIEPKPRVDTIQRIDSVEVVNVSAYTADGVLVADKVAEIETWMKAEGLDQVVDYRFRGASEEVDESGAFLGSAFGLALFLMLIILVSQFNSFYQAFLIISAVIMSTAGVLLGLIITQVPFGVIMNGVGLVALAGIVVNNNIVLIDTFNKLVVEQPNLDIAQRAVQAAKLRFRPVMLTTLTTVIGLMPLANGASIDLINRTVLIDGIVASFWSPMALTIVNGLAFSTILTLLFTPTMLVLPSVLKSLVSRKNTVEA